jgi:uncharacterized protein DUF6457
MSELDAWSDAVCAALDLGTVDAAPILDVAREVAHGVLRPAAPITAFLVGVAVGRGADVATACARVTALASDWQRPGQDG